ncbi:hypothetical protein ACFLZP_02640 [Patescibacteria group bacterium]
MKQHKKILLILVVIVLVLGFGIGAILFLKNRQKQEMVQPIFQTEEEPFLKELGDWTLWEDPAGFKFFYPEDVDIDNHEDDEENYAWLSLGQFGADGGINIWLQETGFTDIEKWVADVDEGQVFDTILGGEPAKKIAYQDPEKMVVAALDVDALLLLEMIPDKDGYWQQVFDRVLESLEFIPLEGESAVAPASGNTGSSGGGGQIVEEAEEVIE